jgi:hypothetical protein
MVVSSLCNMMTTPLLMVDPTLSARFAMWLFTGPWLAGYANKVRNDFYLKPGEAPRAFDMTPLISAQALRQKAGLPATDGLASLAGAWMKEAGRALRFVGTDQVLLVTDSARTVGKWFRPQKPPPPDPSLEPKTSGLGSWMQPSITQNQVGAMLMYIGSVPVLVMGGQPNAVTDVCTKLLAAGILSANTSLFSTALKQKEPTLLVGVPLSVVGMAFVDTTVGMGLSQLSTGIIQNYFRNEFHKTTQQATAKSEMA